MSFESNTTLVNPSPKPSIADHASHICRLNHLLLTMHLIFACKYEKQNWCTWCTVRFVVHRGILKKSLFGTCLCHRWRWKSYSFVHSSCFMGYSYDRIDSQKVGISPASCCKLLQTGMTLKQLKIMVKLFKNPTEKLLKSRLPVVYIDCTCARIA